MKKYLIILSAGLVALLLLASCTDKDEQPSLDPQPSASESEEASGSDEATNPGDSTETPVIDVAALKERLLQFRETRFITEEPSLNDFAREHGTEHTDILATLDLVQCARDYYESERAAGDPTLALYESADEMQVIEVTYGEINATDLAFCIFFQDDAVSGVSMLQIDFESTPVCLNRLAEDVIDMSVIQNYLTRSHHKGNVYIMLQPSGDYGFPYAYYENVGITSMVHGLTFRFCTPEITTVAEAREAKEYFLSWRHDLESEFPIFGGEDPLQNIAGSNFIHSDNTYGWQRCDKANEEWFKSLMKDYQTFTFAPILTEEFVLDGGIGSYQMLFFYREGELIGEMIVKSVPQQTDPSVSPYFEYIYEVAFYRAAEKDANGDYIPLEESVYLETVAAAKVKAESSSLEVRGVAYMQGKLIPVAIDGEEIVGYDAESDLFRLYADFLQ